MPGCGQSRTTPHWRGRADDRLSLCSRNNRSGGFVRHRADVLCWQHGLYHAADRHACRHGDSAASAQSRQLRAQHVYRKAHVRRRERQLRRGRDCKPQWPVRQLDRLRIRWPSIPPVLRPGRCGLSIRLYDGSAMHDAERGFRAGCSAHQVARPPVAAGQAGNQPVVRRHRGRGRQRGSGGLAQAALVGRHVFYSAGPAGSRAATVFRSPERAIYAGVHAHSVRRRRRADARQ